MLCKPLVMGVYNFTARSTSKICEKPTWKWNEHRTICVNYFKSELLSELSLCTWEVISELITKFPLHS